MCKNPFFFLSDTSRDEKNYSNQSPCHIETVINKTFSMGALDFGLDEFAQITVYCRAQCKPYMPGCLLKSKYHCNLCAKK